MTQKEFNRMLIEALREPRVKSEVLQVISGNAIGLRKRDAARKGLNHAGTLAPKGLRAVTPLTKPK